MLDHLEDIRSDLSVLHRVDDMEALPVNRFMSFVERLGHYGGIIAARLADQQRDDAPAPSRPAPPAGPEHIWQHVPAGDPAGEWVDPRAADVMLSSYGQQHIGHTYAPLEVTGA